MKPVSNFRPEDDCDKLNSAMSGERADESVVVSIIPKRSNKQRQQLKATYEQKHKKVWLLNITRLTWRVSWILNNVDINLNNNVNITEILFVS